MRPLRSYRKPSHESFTHVLRKVDLAEQTCFFIRFVPAHCTWNQITRKWQTYFPLFPLVMLNTLLLSCSTDTSRIVRLSYRLQIIFVQPFMLLSYIHSPFIYKRLGIISCLYNWNSYLTASFLYRRRFILQLRCLIVRMAYQEILLKSLKLL